MDEPTTDYSSDEESGSEPRIDPQELPTGSVDHGPETESNKLVPSIFNNYYHLILFSYITATAVDGLLSLLLPSIATSFMPHLAIPTLLRSEGIYSLTLALLCIGIIRALDSNVDLPSILDMSICFHCAASLGNFTLTLASSNAGAFDSYVWLRVVLLVPWLLGFVENQRRKFVDCILPQPSNWR
jgi:hypothetical protein